MNDQVIIAPHNPTFAQRAASEEARWRAACGDALIAWHHIGSTAVPGLMAKPVLDLLPVFLSIDALDECENSVRALGFEWWGEYGLPGRRYCKNAGPEHRIHAHCYAAGSPEITRHTAFRDYLRAHPDQAQSYGRVKQDCAARHANDRNAYGDCKSAWIVAAEQRALTWIAKTETPQ